MTTASDTTPGGNEDPRPDRPRPLAPPDPSTALLVLGGLVLLSTPVGAVEEQLLGPYWVIATPVSLVLVALAYRDQAGRAVAVLGTTAAILTTFAVGAALSAGVLDTDAVDLAIVDTAMGVVIAIMGLGLRHQLLTSSGLAVAVLSAGLGAIDPPGVVPAILAMNGLALVTGGLLARRAATPPSGTTYNPSQQ